MNSTKKLKKGVFKVESRIDIDLTSPILDIFSVNIAHIESNSLSIPILIKCAEENKTVETLGLIDSGAGGEIYWSKLRENPWPQNQTSKQTN